MKRLKHTYVYLGRIVALSILEDGPGILLLSDGPMESCISDSELQEHYCEIIEHASAVGFLVPVNKMTKEHLPLLKTAIVQNHTESAKEELDDFVRKGAIAASISSLKVFNKLLVILGPRLWDTCPSKGPVCETPKSENVKADPVEYYVFQECVRHVLICSISRMSEQVASLIS
ncbi:unnamed protein product [Mytilus coruscus]|uniref:Uncharacterized protein n=1 Tax=Mytilus coruscus TaxID=42192 RepID=A0A6J8BZJ8_MYTCO|nr:unnamed protein product [Mytilus coruscus]